MEFIFIMFSDLNFNLFSGYLKNSEYATFAIEFEYPSNP